MKNEITDKLIVRIADEAIERVGYKEGDSPTPVLEEVVKLLTGLDSIEELWGPMWSLFLVIASSKINFHTDDKTINESIKEVVSRMTGHSLITPYDAVSKMTGIPGRYVSMIDEDDHNSLVKYIMTATRNSIDINIPSPIELGYLYATLGKDANPITVDYLWNKYPETYKLNHDSKIDMVTMLKATLALGRELYRTTDPTLH